MKTEINKMLKNEAGAVTNAEYISILRRRAGLSQSDLFYLTGIHFQHLSEFEKGKRELSDEQIERILKGIKNRDQLFKLKSYLKEVAE